MNNKVSHDLRKKIQDIICEAIIDGPSSDTMPMIHQIIGVLEDLKIGLVTCCHQAGKEISEQKFNKDPSAYDKYMEKHKQRFEELLKKAKNKDDGNDGTTSTAA